MSTTDAAILYIVDIGPLAGIFSPYNSLRAHFPPHCCQHYMWHHHLNCCQVTKTTSQCISKNLQRCPLSLLHFPLFSHSPADFPFICFIMIQLQYNYPLWRYYSFQPSSVQLKSIQFNLDLGCFNPLETE